MNKEVKLILCDLDGTILNAKKEIPASFNEVFAQLQKKEIALGMATGRPLSNINLKFQKVAKHMSCIAENGGCITYQGKIIHTEKISKELCDKIVLKTREIGNCGAVLCALHATYIENKEAHMIHACREYYPDLVLVDDLLMVDDDIVKLSIRDFIDSKTHVGPALKDIDERVDTASSDKHWVDVMNKGVSKGKGIDILCQYMHITLDQIMAFGDEMNDYEMLRKVKYAYAMANAVKQIKSICTYACESNEEDGVMKTLKKEFVLD